MEEPVLSKERIQRLVEAAGEQLTGDWVRSAVPSTCQQQRLVRRHTAVGTEEALRAALHTADRLGLHDVAALCRTNLGFKASFGVKKRTT